MRRIYLIKRFWESRTLFSKRVLVAEGMLEIMAEMV